MLQVGHLNIYDSLNTPGIQEFFSFVKQKTSYFIVSVFGYRVIDLYKSIAVCVNCCNEQVCNHNITQYHKTYFVIRVPCKTHVEFV